MKIIAYHLDFKRAMWSRAYLDSFLERLRQWGYNAIVLEMEDKFRFDGYPEIGHAEAWSHAEAAAFASKCRRMGLQVIPLMQSLGHLEFILGKRKYAHLREAPDLTEHLDVTNPGAVPFLEKIFDEIIDVIKPAHYFHMGGDETWQLGNSPRCQPLLQKIGRGGLYLQHMRPLWAHLRQRGLTPVIWADIVLAHPGIIDEIPKYVALMDWEYWLSEERLEKLFVWGGFGKGQHWQNMAELRRNADAPFRRRLMKYAIDRQTARDKTFRAFYCTDALIDKGFTVLTAPANRSAGDLIGIPISTRHASNCFYFARKGVRDGAGTVVTSWAVRHNHPEIGWPATYAATWGLRRKGPFVPAEFWKAYTAAMYGVAFPDFGDAAALAENGKETYFLHAQNIQDYVRKSDQRPDPLKKCIANLKKAQGGKRKTRLYLENILSDYARAAIMFRRYREQARRNAGNLDFWLEGIGVNELYVRLALAVLDQSPARDRNSLRRALAISRRRTKQLFAGTYLPASVKAELNVRYDLFANYLKDQR